MAAMYKNSNPPRVLLKYPTGETAKLKKFCRGSAPDPVGGKEVIEVSR